MTTYRFRMTGVPPDQAIKEITINEPKEKSPKNQAQFTLTGVPKEVATVVVDVDPISFQSLPKKTKKQLCKNLKRENQTIYNDLDCNKQLKDSFGMRLVKYNVNRWVSGIILGVIGLAVIGLILFLLLL